MSSDRFETAAVGTGLPGVPGVRFYASRSALVVAPWRNENRFSAPAGAVFLFLSAKWRGRGRCSKRHGRPRPQKPGARGPLPPHAPRAHGPEAATPRTRFGQRPRYSILLYGPKAQ